MSSEFKLSRRRLLQLASVSGAGFYIKDIPFLRRFAPNISAPGASLGDPSPFANIDPRLPQKEFAGDSPARPHAILWNKEKYLRERGGVPSPTENFDVAIIGGGVSGLASAYYLGDKKTVVLEQATQFGGNSKAEKWDDLVYGIGAAYIAHPEKGDMVSELLSKIGVLDKLRFEDRTQLSVFMAPLKKMFKPFWEGATDSKSAANFQRIAAVFDKIREEAYPEIPYKDGSKVSFNDLKALDKMSFNQWVKAHLGEVHPHILEYFEEYCWASFAGTGDELSAAQVINFLASDLGGVATLPGGNGGITEALYRFLLQRKATTTLRARAIVVDIKVDADGVTVCYENSQKQLCSLRAKSAVFCGPKFLAPYIVSGLSVEQKRAAEALEYRSFVVANVLLKSPVLIDEYSIFRLHNLVPKNPVQDAQTRVYTDFLFGAWASGNKSPHSTITLYKTFPFFGGRSSLYREEAYAQIKGEFTKVIPELLETLHIPTDQVQDLRLARWGHAIPLARRGLIADGTLDTLRKPVGNRLFFAQQDNWANPCFESALRAAFEAAQQVSLLKN